METITGDSHPALLLLKCGSCNFLLKNHFHMKVDDEAPSWAFFCPNLTCDLFGQKAYQYNFKSSLPQKVVDDKLFTGPADVTIPDQD